MKQSQEWIDAARALAGAFRLGQSVPAALSLVDFVERLLGEAGHLPADRASELEAVVGCLLACQEAHDWLGLADYLEVELVDWVRRVAASG